MAKFEVARRVLIDGEYHEIGSTVEVSGDEAKRLTARGTLVKPGSRAHETPEDSDAVKAAEQVVEAARAEAEKIVADAKAEAETIQNAATEEAGNSVEAARAEAEKIVADAKKPAENKK